MPQKQIFIIEGETALASTLQLAFKQIKSPHRLQVFTSGDSLLDFLSIGHLFPDLILLDYRESNQGGIQVLSALKHHIDWKTIPVILWSSHLTPEQIHECYLLGANAFLEISDKWDEMIVQLEILCEYWFEVVQLPEKPLIRY
ncbi:response regulator [Larkinella sp. C7]|uniref:response regulator n=1 Tax=Larkinella sp. C7 TaxID=2576607 RepID=UPI00111159E5|nr:response regulator [Larkinella sp. C7]